MNIHRVARHIEPANVSVHNDECKLWLKWPVGSVCFASVFVMNEDKSVAHLLLRLDDCLMHA